MRFTHITVIRVTSHIYREACARVFKGKVKVHSTSCDMILDWLSSSSFGTLKVTQVDKNQRKMTVRMDKVSNIH